MNEGTGKAIVLLAVFAAVLAGLGYAISGRLQTGGRGVADVDAKTYDVCHGPGIGYKADYGVSIGAFPEGEIWSTQDLYYAWFKDGKSRPAAVEAGIQNCTDVTFPHVGISDVYYVLSYSENGLTWKQAANDDFPEGVRHMDVDISQPVGGNVKAYFGAAEILIDGFTLDLCGPPPPRPIPSAENLKEQYKPSVDRMSCTPVEKGHPIRDGAALRVDVFVAYDRGPVGIGNYLPTFVASDQVNLRDASASISWSKEGYVVGDTAIVRWETPTATYEECTGRGDGATCVTRPAYFWSVFDMNTNAPLTAMDRVAVGVRGGSKAFAVTPAMFSNDLATCQNRLRAVLYTELVQVNEADASIADLSYSSSVPAVTSITLSKVDIHEGDSVTVTWDVSGNVTAIHLTIWLQGINIVDVDLPGETREYQFVADRSGFGKVMVTSRDRCQPSPTKTQSFAVENVTPGMCDLFPDLPQCSSQNVASLLLAFAAIVAVVVVFFLAFWILSRGKLGERLSEISAILPILLPVGISAIAAFLLIGAGWFDGLLR